MAGWDNEVDRGQRVFGLVGLVAAGALISWAVLLGSRARGEPLRCRVGFLSHGPRCCAPGQGISDGVCVGAPSICPAPYRSAQTPSPGCVLPEERVRVLGGSLTLGPTDWDSAELVQDRKVSVPSYFIDRSEVDHFRYDQCVRAGICQAPPSPNEPGVPVTGVSVIDATNFCAFVGGQLPTPEQWIFAASGVEARRYPWGQHGLVCRRSSYGLANGPCAIGGNRPELSGMRPSGATPDGVLDLSGNVAELTRSLTGEVFEYGGSFRSHAARDLKTWAFRQGLPPDEVGFRCAYESTLAPEQTDGP